MTDEKNGTVNNLGNSLRAPLSPASASIDNADRGTRHPKEEHKRRVADLAITPRKVGRVHTSLRNPSVLGIPWQVDLKIGRRFRMPS